MAAHADVIYLKNGHRIVADSTHEANGRVEYNVGDDTYAIPKSVVDKIDVGQSANVPVPMPAPAADLPQLEQPAPQADALTNRIIHDGKIDAAALKAVQEEGVAARSAVAYFIAGNFEEQRNHLPEAARYLSIGLTFAPAHSIILEHYAAVLLLLAKPAEAQIYAERATRADPTSADAYILLGHAWYRTDHPRDAIAAWKKALSLKPDQRLEMFMERVERESKTEAEFRQQDTGHFLLRYEGTQATDALRNGIVSVLEEQYSTLANDLGAAPRASISVSLYTQQEFFDVTRAAEWSAALNDGKIRVPISGLTEMTPALTHVLRHELTHSFIAQITHSHTPEWLDEGIAQLEEPRSTAAIGQRLASLYQSGNQVPLNHLEKSFQSYSADEAFVAYAEALAATECIRRSYGMSDLARILQRLGSGESVESALRNTIHGGYAELESDIAEYLKRTYGQ
jgi:tetratricopeptide (TPR) repeat protein